MGGTQSVSANSVFFSAVIYITILIGGLIPSAVVGSSPLDFISESGLFYNPIDSVIAAMALSTGFFMVWFSLFYGLAGTVYKHLFAYLMVAVAIIATMDYMIFKPESRSGTLLNTIVYDGSFETSSTLAMIGLAVSVIVLALILVMKDRLGYFLRSLVQVCGIVICIMTGLNMVGIHETIADYKTWKDYQTNYRDKIELPLSSDGQNVVVIMLDRGIGSYVSYIMQERPELKDKLDGFTYYPNTLSYGWHTNMALPAIVGGYEYTPLELNERSDELLGDKHDEALLTMPVLFSEEDFDVTVCDPPYAGYISAGHTDLSIYDEYPNINALRVEGYMNPYVNAQVTVQFNTRKRNLFCYSVMRSMPLILQKVLYNEGNYNAAPTTSEDPFEIDYSYENAHESSGYDVTFMNAYFVLDQLDEVTVKSDNKRGSYLFMVNNLVHASTIVQEPEYEPAADVDNTEYDKEHEDRFTLNGLSAEVNNYEQLRHYESTMTALIKLGEWFDYLRDNDLYDNTRIIIVSDHSYNLGSYPELVGEGKLDFMEFNPLLMVKDYDAHGFEISEEFMTNADVPYLSVNGLIENPINPFTGKEISSDAKNGTQYVLYSNESSVTTNNGTQFIAGDWYSVNPGDVLDLKNWKLVSKNAVTP